MRKSESSLNLSALVVLSAWFFLFSGTVGATDAGMLGPGMTMAVADTAANAANPSLDCPPCVSCYLAPAPLIQSMGDVFADP